VKRRTIEVNISSFSKKGNGLALWNIPQVGESLVEIPFTMPGDLVQAEVERKRSGVYQGKLQAILTPSPDRIKPLCAHFAVCGGCKLQHLTYEHQLQYKEELIRSSFGPLITSKVVFRPIIPSVPWQYRNKMEYSFSSDASGKKFLGLIMEGGQGKVLNLSECHLTHPWFIDALLTVRQWWHESDLSSYNMHNNTGSLRTLTVREGQKTRDRMIILTVSGNPEYALHKGHIESFIAFLRNAVEPSDPACHFSIFLRIQQTQKGMPTQMYEMLLHGQDHIREFLHIQVGSKTDVLSFGISPSAFFQPNTLQAEKIYSHALELAEPSPETIVYDLYCGTGALGICLSKHVKQVFGIELSPESSLDARQNALKNGCENVTIFTGDVQKVLAREKLPVPDIVLIDPPRAGLDSGAIKQIVEMKPAKIVYVSCNPATQADNIKEMLKCGYDLKVIQPIDQFPQTNHVENIALLHRTFS